MGWQDRDYQRGGSGRGNWLRRVFGDGENPFSWAVPLFTAFQIRVKVHVLFILLIVMKLIWSASSVTMGVGHMLMGMGLLFVLVLLHEFGHCFACRWVQGEADEILMWPLGGLASCNPPRHWRAHLVTAVGGPLVNVVLLPVLGGMLLAFGQGWGSVVFNPFQPRVPLGILDSWGMVALWWAYYTNLILLAFNVLCPVFPLDGGRILQSLLWARMGYERSMDIATRIGLVGAAVLFVLGMVGGQTTLMAIALFGGMTCWVERKRMAFMADGGGYAMAGIRSEASRREQAAFDRAAKKQAAQREERARLQQEIDRILGKISREGMASLTKKERQTLERASKPGAER
ncbi:MAG: site-2 protease family protein [Phycisphaeraceae bacterium]|nr:site-2 protease family protein [Phycisphaeraceae bacterium]